jgi:hypothetical protein
MTNESTAPPFEVELDRYVDTVVLPVANQCGGDSGALATWMEQEAAEWRKSAANTRKYLANKVAEPPSPAAIAYFGSEYLQMLRAEDRAAEERFLALEDARADLLEQLAREVIEARAPKTRH